jgi:2-dehydro-3-deoxyphosphogalactonate aldolase
MPKRSISSVSEPFDSIRRLARSFGDKVLIGAGTVTRVDDVARLRAAGGRLVVSPNTDVRVIAAAKADGLIAIPGVATPTEAFCALEAGADALKLFPAEILGPAALRAWRAVLPKDSLLIPVGGVDESTIADWHRAGASAFGIGGAIYKPGMTAKEVVDRSRRLLAAL